MGRSALAALLALVLAGCPGPDPIDSGDPPPEDRDGDGSAADVDCDDTNPFIHPGVTEACNGYDDNCNGVVDIDTPDPPSWFFDYDGDTYGTGVWIQRACEQPSGFASRSGDCDDFDAAVNPEAVEVCNGLDDDCDGGFDEEGEFTTWYHDVDGDGFGDATVFQRACQPPDGYVADATDCDDTRAGVNPGALEVCDGRDDDCDGAVDAGAADAPDWFADRDGDAFGDEGDVVSACAAPSGYTAVGGDCDDGLASVNPDEVERCNGVDDDCDGVADESGATGSSNFYRDRDEDGYGDASASVKECAAPSGYVSSSTDCDDRNDQIHPGITEVCDGVDNNCDGLADEVTAADASTWYLDGDGDGYGLSSSRTKACTRPARYAAVAGDCNDSAASVNPGAIETCDGKDQDCDGVVDDAASDAITYYRDLDGDAYGDPAATANACSRPTGYASVAGDCDDFEVRANPGRTEVCSDGIDNDCDDSPGECVLDSSYDVGDVASAVLLGETSGGCVGEAVAAGDLDGDGYADALVGAPCASVVYAAFGPLAGDLDLDWAEVRIDGPASAELGAAIAGVDDLDDDGDGELLIGAPAASASAGEVWLVSGPARGVSDRGGAAAVVAGGATGDRLGWSVASFDVDGDSSADLVFGAPEASSGGLVYVFTTPPSGSTAASDADVVIKAVGTGDWAGSSVASAGDTDGDGVLDLAIGARLAIGVTGSASGAAYVVLGAGTLVTDLDDAEAAYLGELEEFAGYAVAGADFDDDGYSDVVVGATAPGSGAGSVYIMPGPPTDSALVDAPVRVVGDRTGSELGTRVSAADVDADGVADLVVSAPGSDVGGSGAGAVYVFYAPVVGTITPGSRDGELVGDPGAALGAGVGIGDLDDDGLDDVLMGAPGDGAGAVWLLSGSGL